MLEAFCFNRNYISWVMNIISSSFFTVLVNGVPYGIIKPSRGLRKRDIMSSFLFILMVEWSGRSISTLRDRNSIRGLRVTTRGEKQNHQNFFDETMLMGHPFIQEDGSFKHCLKLFGRASGLEVNEKKSQVLFFNTPGLLATIYVES